MYIFFVDLGVVVCVDTEWVIWDFDTIIREKSWSWSWQQSLIYITADNTQSVGGVMTSISLWRHAAAHTQADRQNPSEHMISAVHYVYLAEINRLSNEYPIMTDGTEIEPEDQEWRSRADAVPFSAHTRPVFTASIQNDFDTSEITVKTDFVQIDHHQSCCYRARTKTTTKFSIYHESYLSSDN